MAEESAEENRISTNGEDLFTASDGSLLVQSARDAIHTFLRSGRVRTPQRLTTDVRFESKRGCFVTLKENNDENSLRGCIGFPEPVYKLSRALTEAAVASATADPRFPPLVSAELDTLLTEVSVLTLPVQIKTKSQEDIPKEIKIGRDGLIMRWAFGSGLLLPQVAKEYGWNAPEFLSNLGMKAGASPEAWLFPGTQIFKFRAKVFTEENPRGKVLYSEG